MRTCGRIFAVASMLMLTAMAAVENIISGRTDKSNIWKVNAEEEYHGAGTTAIPGPDEDLVH